MINRSLNAYHLYLTSHLGLVKIIDQALYRVWFLKEPLNHKEKTIDLIGP